MRDVGRPFWRCLLAAWLLVTNLSLGLYHRHDDDGIASSTTASTAWHYHFAVLGLHLDFLSVNAERSPFGDEEPPSKEVHLLLGTTMTADEQPLRGTAVAAVAVFDLPAPNVASFDFLPLGETNPLSSSPWPGLAHASSATIARSGVQQI